jgi:hypothetical protein
MIVVPFIVVLNPDAPIVIALLPDVPILTAPVFVDAKVKAPPHVIFIVPFVAPKDIFEFVVRPNVDPLEIAVVVNVPFIVVAVDAVPIIIVAPDTSD